MNGDALRLLSFPRISDARGSLTSLEKNTGVPFDIKRVYYLYNTASNASRGGHAHRKTEKIMIAVSGSCEVILDRGGAKTSFTLSSPSEGVLVEPHTWRELRNLSPGTVILALCSLPYEESDYIRNYEHFLSSLETNQ
jgi:dTDP-4-dehydrorhamnose 3,5-epimerase-like enzyme